MLFRDADKRTARRTKAIKKQSKQQTQALQGLAMIQLAQLQAMQQAAAALQQPGPPAAAWYPNPTGPGQRYWDGSAWTEHTAP